MSALENLEMPDTGEQGRRVLVIDDDQDVLSIYRAFLGEAGFSVDTATDGEEGLARSRAHRPDLIVLDLKMPGMSGMEVFSELKEEPKTVGVPVIVLTAIEEEKLAEGMLALGVEKYLVKPIDMQELVATVRQSLTRDR